MDSNCKSVVSLTYQPHPFLQEAFQLTQPHPHAGKRKHGRSLTVMPWTKMILCLIIQLVLVLICILFYSRTKCRWTTVQIQGPKLWNSLSKSLEEIPSPIRFKIKLKQARSQGGFDWFDRTPLSQVEPPPSQDLKCFFWTCICLSLHVKSEFLHFLYN